MIHRRALAPSSRAPAVATPVLALATAVLALATAVLALTTASEARAADDACQPRDGLSTCLTTDNLWPHAGGGPWLGQAPTDTTAADSIAFGLVSTFLHRPVGLRVPSPDPDGTTIYAVEHVLGTSLLCALGLTERLQVSLSQPFVLYQEGAGKADVVGSDDPLPRSAVGDLRFGTAVSLLQRGPQDDGPGLSARFEMTAPTGQDNAFVSSPSAVYAPGASLDYHIGDFALGLDVGARFRRPVDFANIQIGNQISAGLGVGYEVLDDGWLSVNLEAFALFTLAEQIKLVHDPYELTATEEPGDPHIPAEWLLSVRTAALLDGRLRASLGGGSFIPTGSTSAVTTPAFRAVMALHFAPDSGSHD